MFFAQVTELETEAQILRAVGMLQEDDDSKEELIDLIFYEVSNLISAQLYFDYYTGDDKIESKEELQKIVQEM